MVTPLTVTSPDIVTFPLPSARTTVPVAFGNVIILSAVGSTTVRVVSYASAVAPSNTRLTPVSRDTVPVKVGEARGAFKSRAVCVAVDTGLLASVVLSTLDRPTSVFVIPVGVLITGDVRVLLVRVCVLVVPTTAPVAP